MIKQKAYPQPLEAALEHHDAHAIAAHVGADVPAHADAQSQRDGIVEQEAKEVRVERRQARWQFGEALEGADVDRHLVSAHFVQHLLAELKKKRFTDAFECNFFGLAILKCET